MSKKVITVSLSNIDKAIQELEDYKKDILEKTELFRQKVAKRLAEEARSGFSGAIGDDLTGGTGSSKLANVDVTVTERGNMSVVIASGEDAVWVEFGAGVYHNGSVGSSKHPKGAELGFTIGSFGENGKRKVWGYYDEDNVLRLTHGTPTKMPMSRAVSTVINEINSIAKEVFG